MSTYKLSFKKDDVLYTESGEAYRIVCPLGRGGQGEVYKVIGADGEYAVKWYHKDCLNKINKEAFKKNLRKNVNHGVPSSTSGDVATQFIWPLKMMEEKDGSFGYLMKLFPEGYESFAHVVLGQKKDKNTGETISLHWISWFARVTAALNIIRAFEILHASGFSYQDVNDGGFSLNMNNGDVLICDCDNVSPDKTNLGILGMMTFMAPEVVRGERLPERKTDEFSLAVILFRLFLHGHPFEGENSHILQSDPNLTDKQSQMIIYGTHPSYCLASKNNTNPATMKYNRDAFQLGMTYPKVLMDAFEQVFTAGIDHDEKRLTATEWKKILLEVRDHLILIDNYEAFYGKRHDKALPAECRILTYKGGREVLCMPGKILYENHFDPKSNNFNHQVGKVISTSKEGVIGIYYEGDKEIEFECGGKKGLCGNKHRMPLFKDMIIHTGNTDIKVI